MLWDYGGGGGSSLGLRKRVGRSERFHEGGEHKLDS